MKKILPVLFFMTAWLSFAADPIQHRSASEAYVDPDLKVSFPADAGTFRKNEVSRSFNPMIGTKIRYSAGDGACADIYIYSLPNAEQKINSDILKKHFEEAKKAVLGLPAKGLSMKQVVLSAEKCENRGNLQIYSADFILTWNDGSSQSSSMKLFPSREKIVKLRISGTKDHAEQFSTVIVNAFLNP